MSLLCILGFHDWITEDKRMGTAIKMISGNDCGRVDIKAELQKCSCCGKERGLLIDESGEETAKDYDILKNKFKKADEDKEN